VAPLDLVRAGFRGVVDGLVRDRLKPEATTGLQPILAATDVRNRAGVDEGR
jgi:hypothetical protein